MEIKTNLFFKTPEPVKIAGEKEQEPALPVDTLNLGKGIDIRELDLQKIQQAIFAKTPPRIAWKFQTERSPYDTPAVSPDGKNIYVSDSYSIYNLTDRGVLMWKKPLEQWSHNRPTAGADNSVYIASKNTLHAFRPDGSTKWTCDLKDNYHSIQAGQGPDGTLFMGTKNGNLHAINPDDGAIKWTKTLESATCSRPAVSPDGSVAVVDNNDKVYVFDKNGNPTWQKIFKSNKRVDHTIEMGPSYGPDGTLYLSSKDKILYAFNPDGSEKWTYKAAEPLKEPPVADKDGNLYLPLARQHSILSLSPDGHERWSFKMGDLAQSPPVVGPDGNLYVSGYDQKLYVLKPTDGSVLWSQDFDTRLPEPVAVGNDGGIYLNNLDGHVYSLRGDQKMLDMFKKEEKKPEDQNQPDKDHRTGEIRKEADSVDIDGITLHKKKKKW